MTEPKNDLTPQTPATSPEQPRQPATCLAEDPRTSALVPSAPPAPTETSPAAASLALQFTAPPPARPRYGKIAQLPKLEREMVNRMLANNLPQEKIVAALDECGFHVTQRNVSNWRTRGGYKEWCAAQAHALELRTFQDNLTGFLRRHDAAELPEVGLQSASTNISAILLRPDLTRELLASPEKYSRLIELQCRLAREIQALQKNRDDAAKSVGCNPERLKREDEEQLEVIRETYSSKIGEGPRDPNIPHRNYIPKELEPIEHITTTRPFGLDTLREFQALLAARRSSGAPPAKP